MVPQSIDNEQTCKHSSSPTWIVKINETGRKTSPLTVWQRSNRNGIKIGLGSEDTQTWLEVPNNCSSIGSIVCKKNSTVNLEALEKIEALESRSSGKRVEALEKMPWSIIPTERLKEQIRSTKTQKKIIFCSEEKYFLLVQLSQKIGSIETTIATKRYLVKWEAD